MIASTRITKPRQLTTRVSRPGAIRTRYIVPAGPRTVVVGASQSIELVRPAQGPYVTLSGPNAAPVYLTPAPQVIAVTQVTRGLTGAPGTAGGGDALPTSPSFTWLSGVLTGIDYPDGSSKSLTWVADRLEQIDFARPGITGVRKNLSYNPDGTLAAIAQSAF